MAIGSITGCHRDDVLRALASLTMVCLVAAPVPASKGWEGVLMRYRALLVIGVALAAVGLPARAAEPLPSIATLAAREARRFPQPVRVGDLIGRDVLKPVEAQPILGTVAAVVRRKDGGLDVIVQFGGVLGFGARPIAVPIEAMALMGPFMAVMDFSPAQLQTFPTDDGAGLPPVPPNDVIRVGIVKPFH